MNARLTVKMREDCISVRTNKELQVKISDDGSKIFYMLPETTLVVNKHYQEMLTDILGTDGYVAILSKYKVINNQVELIGKAEIVKIPFKLLICTRVISKYNYNFEVTDVLMAKGKY